MHTEYNQEIRREEKTRDLDLQEDHPLLCVRYCLYPYLKAVTPIPNPRTYSAVVTRDPLVSVTLTH
jgi:hypothetical protein